MKLQPPSTTLSLLTAAFLVNCANAVLTSERSTTEPRSQGERLELGSTNSVVAPPPPRITVWSSPKTEPRLPSRTASRTRPRVLVSTDIGGTDYDDLQSFVHFLVYANEFDVEGLVSSPWGEGRTTDILRILDLYEKDYQNLKSHSPDYPSPQVLRGVTKQGALVNAGYAGFAAPTEGSQWIVAVARRKDPRPLWVLVWGGIDDLAQALHDAPDIENKLRVYFIGGPNKKWSVSAYRYISQHHPRLWIIEANATYRGWFTGGDQSGEWSNGAFPMAHVAGRGALGDYFASLRAKPGAPVEIKMGDTPSVVYLLRKTPEKPSEPGWGGRFVRAWDRSTTRWDRLPKEGDQVEEFSVVELALPIGSNAPRAPFARIEIDNQSGKHAIPGFLASDGTFRFLFSPKTSKRWTATMASNVSSLNQKIATFISVPAARDAEPSADYPNWWTDDPAPEAAEGPHIGAKTVSRWRHQFLGDFSERMLRCKAPKQ